MNELKLGKLMDEGAGALKALRLLLEDARVILQEDRQKKKAEEKR